MFRGLVPLLYVLAATSVAVGPASDAPAPASGAPAREALNNDLPVRPLPFFYDLYTFRGDSGNTTVIASFAVPVGRLERARLGRDVLYRFDVTLVLSDTALHSVSRTDDSVFVAVPQRLSGGHLLYTHVEVQAPPSVSTLHRVIMTDASKPGIGQMYSAPFRIPDYSGSHLMLSDIAMGQPDPQGGWSRGNVTLALLPTDQFPGSSFELYYEIYNLPFGSQYDTEVSIEPVDESGAPRDGEDSEVRIRFSGESNAFSGRSQDELRHVDASLARGRYRLTVTVTDQKTDQSATRSRLFQVRGSGRGATMVRALPAKRMGQQDQ